ncbi:MAG: zf-HC2 domain-containing protein [Pseudomonadota bacterium]
MTRKISCEEVMSKLYAYLDNEVDRMEEADITAHIHECRECYSRAEFEKALRRKVAASVEVEVPEETRGRLEALIKRF